MPRGSRTASPPPSARLETGADPTRRQRARSTSTATTTERARRAAAAVRLAQTSAGRAGGLSRMSELARMRSAIAPETSGERIICGDLSASGTAAFSASSASPRAPPNGDGTLPL